MTSGSEDSVENSIKQNKAQYEIELLCTIRLYIIYVTLVYTIVPVIQLFSVGPEDVYSNVTMAIKWTLNITIYIGLIMSKVKSIKLIYILIFVTQLRTFVACYHKVFDEIMSKDHIKASA